MVKRVFVLGQMAAAGLPATPRPYSQKAVVKAPVCPRPSQVFYRPKFRPISGLVYGLLCVDFPAFKDALTKALKEECGVDDGGNVDWDRK